MWQHYIDVIYMNESDTMAMDYITASKDVDGMMNIELQKRLEEVDTNQRLNSIFGPEETSAMSTSHSTKKTEYTK